jgi:hypothetical protein
VNRAALTVMPEIRVHAALLGFELKRRAHTAAKTNAQALTPGRRSRPTERGPRTAAGIGGQAGTQNYEIRPAATRIGRSR